jgi:hypothetical protein
VTLGESELVMGLGLLLILALAGLAVAVLRWQRAVSHGAAAVELSDGAVLIVEDGTVVEASAQAVALLGPAVGQQAREVLGAFLGLDSGSDSGPDAGPDADAALEALARLEQSGDAIHLLATDATGRPFELAGEPRGGQLRLVLREAALLDAELNSARAETAAREQAVAQRELETRTLAGLLADAPLAAWNRTPDGRIAWSAGRVPTRHGTVAAAEAAAMAVIRAKRRDGQPEQAGNAAGQAERFRLEIAGPENGEAIALDAIEAAGPDGARLGLAVDASGALAAERTLARFVRTMTETFAHLNVGLAIFDRNQTLALFNPALVEMWRADPACQSPN